MVLKQLGPGPELVHCHATLTLEAFLTSAVTSVGVGGAGVDTMEQLLYDKLYYINIPLAGRLTIMGRLLELFRPPLA